MKIVSDRHHSPKKSPLASLCIASGLTLIVGCGTIHHKKQGAHSPDQGDSGSGTMLRVKPVCLVPGDEPAQCIIYRLDDASSQKDQAISTAQNE